jgi:hypothetical protein
MARRIRTRGQLRKVSEQIVVKKQQALQTIGTDGQVAFNDDGSNRGSNNLTFDEDTKIFRVSGSIGINTSDAPTHGLTLPDTSDTSGKVKANAFVSYSSIRFKKDVQKLENAMDVINQLEGVSYKWKDTDAQDYGLIAEEVGKVLPEIVEWEDEENATSIDYIKIISFLVEAVKYQYEQLNLLHDKIGE